MQSQEIRKEKEEYVGIHKLHSEQHHLQIFIGKQTLITLAIITK